VRGDILDDLGDGFVDIFEPNVVQPTLRGVGLGQSQGA
jgi:hypothetical protein